MVNDFQTPVIKEVEAYVRNLLPATHQGEVKGHDWKHAFRVRSWGRKIARGEGFGEPFLLEIACLLHDIGRLNERVWGITHEKASERMAEEYLKSKAWFSEEELTRLLYAIGNHSKGGDGGLVCLLQDADRLDGLGAMGIAREFQHHWYLSDYDPEHVLKPFTMRKDEVDAFFTENPQKPIVAYALDSFAFQLSWYERMHTNTAKELAKPLVAYMSEFLHEFEREAKNGEVGEVIS